MVVVLDCNIWITLTINGQTKIIADLSDKGHLIASCLELRTEITTVTNRPKLINFVTSKDVEKLIQLHDLVTTKYRLGKIKPVVSDLKDNYLFALSVKSKAVYIITGDKLLLKVESYGDTKIINLAKFKQLFDY